MQIGHRVGELGFKVKVGILASERSLLFCNRIPSLLCARTATARSTDFKTSRGIVETLIVILLPPQVKCYVYERNETRSRHVRL